MDIIEEFKAKIRGKSIKIVLPELEDGRIVEGVRLLIKENLVYPILVGDKNLLPEDLKKFIPDKLNFIDINNNKFIKNFAFQYYELRRHKGIGFYQAKQIVRDPLIFGAMLVLNDEADGMVAGAMHTTAQVLRASLTTIKTAKDTPLVSGCFIMVFPTPEFGENGIMLFADSAVNPEPDSRQLAYIALSTAKTAKELLNIEPKIAFLSFSTKGSAKHHLVNKVVKAFQIAKSLAPDLTMDGELQLDAAVIPMVAQKKAPDSPLAGKANILIFPDLNAGNIGYKMAERFGKAKAVGPVLQGLKKPVNDLSRGCSVEDVVNTVAITATQALFS